MPSRYKSITSVSQILNRGHFKRLAATSDKLQVLDLLFKEQLPAKLKAHCTVTQYEKTVLSVSVANSAIATKLRYATPQLTQALASHAEFYSLRSIKFHVDKNVVLPKPIRSRPMAKLSRKNSDLLRQSAEAIEDPELSAALIRLSKNT